MADRASPTQLRNILYRLLFARSYGHVARCSDRKPTAMTAMTSAAWTRAPKLRQRCNLLKWCGVTLLLVCALALRSTWLLLCFGRAAAQRVASGCELIVSIEGETQCLAVHNAPHANRHGHHTVDAVYTWVNPTDPDWRRTRRTASGTTFGHFGKDDLSDARRFNNGVYPDAELCASLELLRTNMPWIRHVWIVTMRPQRPTCAHPGMRVVHHDELGLPLTFNIFSIETRLQHIPGMSERFVYMNDDFYVMNPMPASAFFAADGRPIVWTEPFDVGHLFRTCVHTCDATNRLILPLMHGKRMLSVLHGPKGVTISMLNSTASIRSLKCKVEESTRSIMRSHGDFMTIVAAQNLAVVSGTALLSTSIPTFEMVDTVPRVPFRRSVDIACINGAVFNTAEDIALFRKALWLKP